jgi:hypothetical protein
VVSGNFIENSCTWPAVHGFGNDQNGGDCGAIYFHDPISSSTNVQIANNYVRDVNLSSNGAGDNGANGKAGCCAEGVYLDDGTSNVAITGNVLAGVMSGCIQMNDGENNVITGLRPGEFRISKYCYLWVGISSPTNHARQCLFEQHRNLRQHRK